MAKQMARPTGVPHKEHGMPIGGDAYTEMPPETIAADTPSEERRKSEVHNRRGKKSTVTEA